MIKTSVAVLTILMTYAPAYAQDFSVRDDLARMVQRPPPPLRIVSLAPSITETLFALGLDSSIVGVTDFCNYPDAARKKPRVGGMNNPNLEQITSLRPNLVVMSISGNNRGDFDKLISLGMNVFVSDPRTIEGVFKSIHDLGAICDRSPSAQALIDSLRTAEQQLLRKTAILPMKSAILLLSLRPIITVGKSTFVGELLNLANARNLTQDAPTSYPMVGREEILRLQPDVILVTGEVAHDSLTVLSEYPEWSSLAAAHKGRIAFIDADLISRPGPRIIRGLEQIIRAIHGD